MTQAIEVGDRVSWNSEAGRVSGTIIRVHIRDVDHKDYTRSAAAVIAQRARKEPMSAYFTSNHHFGHAGALGLYRRPFASVAEMDRQMIDWNVSLYITH